MCHCVQDKHLLITLSNVKYLSPACWIIGCRTLLCRTMLAACEPLHVPLCAGRASDHHAEWCWVLVAIISCEMTVDSLLCWTVCVNLSTCRCVQDKRLIITLSDVNHTLEIVIPRIIDNLNKHGYVEMNKAAKVRPRAHFQLLVCLTGKLIVCSSNNSLL